MLMETAVRANNNEIISLFLILISLCDSGERNDD